MCAEVPRAVGSVTLRAGESLVGLLRGSVGSGVGWDGEGARFSGGEPEC